MSHGLLEEAATDFEKSLEIYPYDPVCYFALGQAATLETQWSRALDAFKKAYRYSINDAQGLAAGAALQAAGAARSGGDGDEARAVLEQATKDIPDCAELWFARSRVSESTDALERALELKPQLALHVRALGMQLVDDAARRVFAREIEPRLARLGELLDGVQVPHRPIKPTADPVALLLRGTKQLNTVDDHIRTVQRQAKRLDRSGAWQAAA